jgi:nitrate reductase alpha subunit
VEHACEAILALSGTTNGRIAVEGFKALERRAGVPLASLAEARADERITFADAQVQPRTVMTSPEWSGIDEHGRRYSPFTINVERAKPWHTLSGRQHLYLDHEWMLELGEGLPNYRPPLVRGAPTEIDIAGSDRPELALRYLTPHSKWSIHSEYQDNLHMLTLFRGGAVLWLAREDAEALGVADNDWVEAYNRNGVMACRATVSHRIPKGVCLMYHAKDRHLQTPRTELLGNRGGTDNSVTRIIMKPSHMIGGYAQLSAGFNYYGPTGSQRDEVVIVRRREAEVTFP